ncbi:LysR family transcriptional regulator [Stappia sp. TSB10GB4]|uniref:LysR family transcriptional regulator n=1 Tax=Stappia sp. TSB10GB4 TaxID=2003584 RepID=UPI001644B99A|nr:LysR family transcriptional regulator [Stappia sp. TSB10GB4]
MDRSRTLYGPALRYFAAVARSGSIRSAARELNVASSAVNRQILWLEQSLGHTLFDRLARGVQLTPAGEILRAHVLRTFADLEATLGDLDALTGMQRGTVRIASVESVTESLLPDVVAAFRRSYPGIHLHLVLTGSEQVVEAIIAGEADVGFAFEPPDDPRLAVAFHRDLEIGALVRPGHPLTRRERVSLADCLVHSFCFPSSDLSLRKRLDMALADGGFPPGAFVEANSLKLMKELTRSDDTVAFLTTLGLERDLVEGSLVFLPLAEQPLKRDRFTILTSAHRSLGHAARAFFDHSVDALRARLAMIDANSAS